MTRVDPQLSRDIAKQLDRRRMRRRLLVWTVLLAAIAAAVMYLRCGDGLGLGGGKGPGKGPGEVRPLTDEPKRCAIRVAKDGVTVNGKPMLRDEVVATCKAAGAADVIVTGDAREGDWAELRGALEAAGVTDLAVHARGAK